MMNERVAFWLMVFVNTLIALLYLAVYLLRKSPHRRKAYFTALAMFLCPVVGPCYFLFSWICQKVFFNKPVDLSDVVFNKERVQTFLHAEEDRERNIVPLEEAFEVTDTDNLRAVMMNVVRGDIRESLSSIALALNSDDTETAHYAASVLQDALNDFRMNVQKQQNFILEADENQADLAAALIDYMDQVLRQQVFNDLEQRHYVGVMEEICEILYSAHIEQMTSAQYEAVCLRLLEIKAYDLCEKWCQRAVLQYPQSLPTYTCQLKLYFNSGQRERFFEVIEELKHSSVVIDSETLELIRVFS